MVKLDKCIDCQAKLTEQNRSKLQPGIRCLGCFEIFNKDVTKTLEDMIAEMDEQALNLPAKKG
ncbi:hypothetical protein LCGC14_0376190 [marine sediment metagenome]|uniref:Uncharacterized protein n=1 Tax=marine sediment metagenome TaxID=412755 RepID=A0A0F9VR23_9ZZZZ